MPEPGGVPAEVTFDFLRHGEASTDPVVVFSFIPDAERVPAAKKGFDLCKLKLERKRGTAIRTLAPVVGRFGMRFELFAGCGARVLARKTPQHFREESLAVKGLALYLHDNVIWPLGEKGPRRF